VRVVLKINTEKKTSILFFISDDETIPVGKNP
jgi:hypothetical protein